MVKKVEELENQIQSAKIEELTEAMKEVEVSFEEDMITEEEKKN